MRDGRGGRPSPGTEVNSLALGRPGGPGRRNQAPEGTGAAAPAVLGTAGPFTGSVDDLRVAYEAHGGEILRYCHRILDDRGLAEEAAQETFLRAWKSWKRWDPRLGSFRSWLFTIAKNVSTDLLRARTVRPPLAKAAEPPEQAVEDFLEGALRGWMVEEGLRRIREDQRRAIMETFVSGRPYAEVAAELGVPEGTLRSRVFYGLKALRLALEEMGWGDE